MSARDDEFDEAIAQCEYFARWIRSTSPIMLVLLADVEWQQQRIRRTRRLIAAGLVAAAAIVLAIAL